MHREEDAAVHFWRLKENFQSQFPHSPHGLTVGGKHAWQDEEEIKEDSSTVLMLQEQLFISELFKDVEDANLLILHYRTMLLFRSTFIMSDVQSIFIPSSIQD